jgi:hypothetical protein
VKWIREVDDLRDANEAHHVRLDVLLMPSDITKVAGLVTMNDPEPDHQVGSHRSAQPMEIDVARSLAWKIARERGADVIWINDPKSLFPTHVRTISHQMRTFAVHVMPGGKLTDDVRIEAVSTEVAALAVCGEPLVAEHGSMGNLVCQVFDGPKKILFYRPPDAPIIGS